MKKVLFSALALTLCLVVSALAAEPVKIGAFFALSGPAAAIGTPTKLVAQMAADKINKEGGIGGRPIELALGDTESEPTKGVMVFKKFLAVDKVVAVIGPTRTDTGNGREKAGRGGENAHGDDRGGRPGDHGRQGGGQGFRHGEVRVQDPPAFFHGGGQGVRLSEAEGLDQGGAHHGRGRLWPGRRALAEEDGSGVRAGDRGPGAVQAERPGP